MNALDELKKVIRYYEEDKTNPSTLKNQISGETLKELDAELAALRDRVEAVEVIVSWLAGDLSEGQAAKKLNIERLKLRTLRDEIRAAALAKGKTE